MREIEATEKQMLQLSLKRLHKQIHSDLPNDTELKIPKRHEPLDPNFLLSKVSNKHQGILEKLASQNQKKKHPKKRPTMIRKTLNQDSASKMRSKLKRLTVMQDTQMSELSQSNWSKTFVNNPQLQNSVQNTSHAYSNTSENPFLLSPVKSFKDADTSKRVSIFLTQDNRPKKSVDPVSLEKDLFNFTVATNLNYKTMRDDRSFLNQRLGASELKRKQTFLGRFVSNVDHTDLFSKKNYFGITDRYLETWRSSSLRDNKSAEDTIFKTLSRAKTATSSKTQNAFASHTYGSKFSKESEIGIAAVNENTMISLIRSDFLLN